MGSVSVHPEINLLATQDAPRVSVQHDDKEKLRQQMYRRIATGNALAEAEATARQRWQSTSSG
jgi:hypothetical protein